MTPEEKKLDEHYARVLGRDAQTAETRRVAGELLRAVLLHSGPISPQIDALRRKLLELG